MLSTGKTMIFDGMQYFVPMEYLRWKEAKSERFDSLRDRQVNALTND